MNMYVWNQDMKVRMKWSAGISFFYAKEQIEAKISITSNIKISFIATDIY